MAQAIPVALMAASTALSAGGTIIGANAEARSLKSEATQLDTQAGQDRASSQRAAIEQRRQARLLQSRAQAVGAASGGASDPTVVNIISRLAGEGQYRALTALYEGEEMARSKEMQARARRQEAKNTKRAGYISAAGQVLGGASSIYSRFGGGGPSGSSSGGSSRNAPYWVGDPGGLI